MTCHYILFYVVVVGPVVISLSIIRTNDDNNASTHSQYRSIVVLYTERVGKISPYSCLNYYSL
jgi:hypothetical protein